MIPWTIYDERWMAAPTVVLGLLSILGGAALVGLLPALIGWVTVFRKNAQRAGVINALWSASILTVIAVLGSLTH